MKLWRKREPPLFPTDPHEHHWHTKHKSVPVENCAGGDKTCKWQDTCCQCGEVTYRTCLEW